MVLKRSKLKGHGVRSDACRRLGGPPELHGGWYSPSAATILARRSRRGLGSLAMARWPCSPAA